MRTRLSGPETSVHEGMSGSSSNNRRCARALERSGQTCSDSYVQFRLPPAKMHLVQDLVDYITDFLHDDPATLMQTSLVSKAWVGRARVHLCETMNITNRKLVSLRLSYLTPLSGYVKTLYFPWPRDITKLPALLDCFEQSEPHTLAIDCWEAGNLDEQGVLGCFVKFPCLSITSLELLDVYPTLATPLILLPLFSNVDDLTISMCAWSRAMLIPVESEGRNDEITQTTSLPCLRGSFMFLDPPSNPWGFRRDILHTVAALPLQFQAVSLEINRQSLEDSLDLLNSCSKTVREVSVEVSERRTPTGMYRP